MFIVLGRNMSLMFGSVLLITLCLLIDLICSLLVVASVFITFINILGKDQHFFFKFNFFFVIIIQNRVYYLVYLVYFYWLNFNFFNTSIIYIGFLIFSTSFYVCLGFMHFLGLTLSAITCNILILSVGLSIDFAAHIAYGYLASTAEGRRGKVLQALEVSYIYG